MSETRATMLWTEYGPISGEVALHLAMRQMKIEVRLAKKRTQVLSSRRGVLASEDRARMRKLEGEIALIERGTYAEVEQEFALTDQGTLQPTLWKAQLGPATGGSRQIGHGL